MFGLWPNTEELLAQIERELAKAQERETLPMGAPRDDLNGTCPLCGADAFVGANLIDCIRLTCENYKAT